MVLKNHVNFFQFFFTVNQHFLVHMKKLKLFIKNGREPELCEPELCDPEYVNHFFSEP